MADEERLKALESLKKARRMVYLADMPTVDQAMRENNVTRARWILDQHRPQPGVEDLREWEWFYFERLAWADESELIGIHPGGTQSLLTSAGDVFVTVDSSQRSIRVGDSTREKLLHSFTAPDDASTFALSSDGKRLAIARRSEIEIRSLNERFALLRTLTGWKRQPVNVGRIRVMRFTSGDTGLIIATDGGGAAPYPLTFVDIESDTSVPAEIGGSTLEVIAFETSADDKLGAALVGLADEIVIFRLPGCQLVSRFKVDRLRIGPPAIAFLGQNEVVISTEEGRMGLWDVNTGLHIRSIGEHAAGITALAVSRDGKRLASAGLDSW